MIAYGRACKANWRAGLPRDVGHGVRDQGYTQPEDGGGAQSIREGNWVAPAARLNRGR